MRPAPLLLILTLLCPIAQGAPIAVAADDSHAGDETTLLAISREGDAHGMIAIAPDGDAQAGHMCIGEVPSVIEEVGPFCLYSGGLLAASSSGEASGGGVLVSLLGNASGGLAAISVRGHAGGGTAAASVLGSAGHENGPSAIGIAPTGQAEAALIASTLSGSSECSTGYGMPTCVAVAPLGDAECAGSCVRLDEDGIACGMDAKRSPSCIDLPDVPQPDFGCEESRLDLVVDQVWYRHGSCYTSEEWGEAWTNVTGVRTRGTVDVNFYVGGVHATDAYDPQSEGWLTQSEAEIATQDARGHLYLQNMRWDDGPSCSGWASVGVLVVIGPTWHQAWTREDQGGHLPCTPHEGFLLS